MKNSFTYLFLGCVMGASSLTVKAQTPLVVDRGATVELKANDGFTSYQWQVSSDKKNYFNLPNGNVQNLNLKVYAPGYYRVKVTDADKKTSYIDVFDVSMSDVHYSDKVSISGGAHGFVETTAGVADAKGINIPEDREGSVAGTTKKLTNWTDGNAMAVWYFNHPADIVDTEMVLKLKSGSNVSFRIKVIDPDHAETPLAENIVALKGTGAEQTVKLIGTKFPRKAYYRYQLECLSGWSNIMEISKFKHYSPSTQKTYKPGYLSSPSVHLNGWTSTKSGTPKGPYYDWCYEEVMMPKESDITGTYVMSLGVLKGYMGIQMNGWKNGQSLHEVLFSMWDDGDTQANPNLPDYLRASVLDHNPNARVNRFGNEGTGMQTFLEGHHWECGTFVQFITNCRKERVKYTEKVGNREVTRYRTNSLVSAWFNAQDGKGWQYMSTLRLPSRTQPFDSWYSFLENYNYPTGQALRTGYYKNGYARKSSGSKSWYHFNKVGFGHTDGSDAEGARYDFSQGASEEIPGAFVMKTGGFISSEIGKTTVPLNEHNTAVDTINLAALEARVDQAIAHEKKQIEIKENFEKNKMDKKGWKVVRFSSQETSGEGSNGRAAQTIDGDINTYWHSQWQGGGSHCPHFLIIDMKEVHNINGMQIRMSGGSKRYMKAFNLYVSTDNKQWEKVYSDDDAPDQEVFQFMLDKPVEARYFKIEITKSRATDGEHVRISEIDVTEALNTGVENVQNNQKPVDVIHGNGAVAVRFNKVAKNVQLSLFRADGANVLTDDLLSVENGEVVVLPMQSVVSGVYVLTCQIDGKKISKQFVWKK